MTYQLFERHWPFLARTGSGPEHEVELARKLDNKRKYVLSSTLRTLEWQKMTLKNNNTRKPAAGPTVLYVKKVGA